MDIDILLVTPRIFYNPKSNLPENVLEIYENNEELLKRYIDLECEKRSVNLPFSGFGYIGQLSIASFLEKNNFSVELFCPDDIITFERYKKLLMKFLRQNNVKSVGLGPYTYQYPTALAISRIIKNTNSNIYTIIGGHHVTFLDQLVFEDSPFVDFVVRGEGEWVIKNLLEHIENNKIPRTVKGITYKINNKIKRNPDAQAGNIKELPPLKYDMLQKQNKEMCGHISISRGCPYNCTFCSEKLFWKYPRYKSSNQINKEISTLVNEYHVKHIRFADDTFTANPKIVAKVCEYIRNEHIDLEYSQIWTRADTINTKIIKQLNNLSNTIEVCLGIENASNKVLNIMHKNQTIQQNIKALKIINKNNMIAHGFWILGHPSSDMQKEKYTTNFIKNLIKNKICMLNETSIFTPYPGSAVYSNPEKFGVNIQSFDWSKYCENPPSFPTVYSLKNLTQEQIFELFKERYKTVNSMLSSTLLSS